MVDFEYKTSYDVDDLKKIIALLRGESGCPWDREQTHESIRRNFLEETYEACEAIDTGDNDNLREELGDVLTQVLFHAEIEEEAGRWGLSEVADEVCKKLISRHPHVFGERAVAGVDEVLTNWDEIKRLEKKQSTTASAMDSVAKSLPALWRAEKIQAKAGKIGFDWPDVRGAWDKLTEETAELREAILGDGRVEEELGDLLFSAVNVARLTGIDPEEALHGACEKFIRRFRYMEDAAGSRGTALCDMSLDEMEALYQEGKKRLEGTKVL